MIINKYINPQKSGILVILILMYGIVVSSGLAVCGFSSFWQKQHSVKKTLHGVVVLFLCNSPRADFQVGGAKANTSNLREQTSGSGCMLPRKKFKFKSSEMAIKYY